MSRFEVIAMDEVDERDGHPSPTCRTSGDVRSRLGSPADYPLWLAQVRLAPGSRLTWDGRHGDEAVYVRSGSVSVDGTTCPDRSTVVVEADAETEVVASDEGAVVLHFGPWDAAQPTDGHYGPPQPGPRGVHLVGPRGRWGVVDGPRASCYYADSTCPTCRISLMFTSRTTSYRAASHTHSQDELIHVLGGELHLGKVVAPPGTTLAIPAEHRYGFRSPDCGYAFLNYRRDVSTYVTTPGSPALLEDGPMMGMARTDDLL